MATICKKYSNQTMNNFRTLLGIANFIMIFFASVREKVIIP